MLKTSVDPRTLASLYSRAHSLMRNTDGLQPQEAFDELLKYLFFKQINEERGPELSVSYSLSETGLFAEDYYSITEEIRRLFSEYLKSANSWSDELWRDGTLHLSDEALFALYQLFQEIEFGRIPFDTRSMALREFLPSGVRKGLGIYLTPDDVVKMIVEFANPEPGTRIYDPACGSGTFLIEVLKLWTRNAAQRQEVLGADKNPRMLLLAELNIGHLANATFKRMLGDSLSGSNEDWIMPNSIDGVFTNPPFGVVLTDVERNLSEFTTCRNAVGETLRKQYSEVVFAEKSLRLLRPGGTLSIVLPRSVLTNATFAASRAALDALGYIYGVVTLPPETFQMTGTQATTVVLFIKKYKENELRSDRIGISLAEVKNVGYDSTGRVRKGNQLPDVAENLKRSLAQKSSVGVCKILPEISKDATFTKISDLISSNRQTSHFSKTLRDVALIARTGRTPARAAYSDSNEGIFVVKVGNLTGKGVNWQPRDRNFIKDDGKLRTKSSELLLRENDILLTSSAHSPVYIAKKIDIITKIPSWLNETASLVGEVMLLRPRLDKVDPFNLLAYLRLPETMEEIQRKVRGQTAHLHAEDLLDLPIPDVVFSSSGNMQLLASNLKREAKLNDELNTLVYERDCLINDGI